MLLNDINTKNKRPYPYGNLVIKCCTLQFRKVSRREKLEEKIHHFRKCQISASYWDFTETTLHTRTTNQPTNKRTQWQTKWLNNSLAQRQHNRTIEANTSTDSSETPRILWNRKLHYHFMPHPTFWRSISILSSHLLLGLPNGLFPSGFPAKSLFAPLLSTTRATCPAHQILLDLITRIKFGEEFRP